MVCFVTKTINGPFITIKRRKYMNEIEFLKDLVSIKSFNTKENKQIIEYLKNKLSPFASEIITLTNKTDGRQSLLVGINTKLKNVSDAIVLSGHIDTVVADEKLYTTNPFAPTIANGKMFGLGTIDMKSFFACILSNLEVLKSKNRPIVLAITGDEETTLEGITLVAKQMQQSNISPAISIIGEPTDMDICLSSKSCYEYQVEILGKGCHSSAPQNGINANYIAARIMLFIEKLNMKINNTSLSCNIINGGEKVNIISSFAKLSFDIRSPYAKFATKAVSKIRQFASRLQAKYKGCQISITKTLEIPALEKRKSKTIDKLIRQFSLKEKEFRGGCEAGYLQQVAGDALVFGVGDLNLAHKPNEFVVIDQLQTYNKKLMQMIDLLCKQ